MAGAEQEALQVKMVTEQLMRILRNDDANHDSYISKEEFSSMMDKEEARSAFTDVGVDTIAMIRDPDLIFAGDECISFKEFMDEVLTLRGSNQATVKDITQLKKQILRELQGINKGRGTARQRLMQKLHGSSKPAERRPRLTRAISANTLGSMPSTMTLGSHGKG